MEITATKGASSRGFSFDTAALWSLILTIGLALLAFIPSASVSFLYTKVSLLAVGAIATLALFIIARLTRGNIIVPPVLLLGALWIVPLSYALSALFSGIGLSRAFFGAQLETDTFGFVLLSALLGTLAALILRRKDTYKLFFKAGLVTFGLILVSEIVFVVLGQIIPNTLSATSNLIGSFGDLGIFVGLGAALLLLALRFLPLQKKVKMFSYAALGVSLFVLALVNAVAVWVLLGLVALGLFIESVMRRKGTSEDTDLEGVVLVEQKEEALGDVPANAIVAPLVTLVVALFFVIGGQTIGSLLSGALHTGVLDVRPSWQATFGIGSHTFASAPLFGTGPGTFADQWLKFKDRSLNETVFWNLDFTSGIGYVPTSFITTGVVGAIAWVLFFGVFLFFGLRFLLLRASTDPFLRFVSLASFVGAVYLFALSVISAPGPLPVVLAFVLTGVFVSSLRHGKDANEWGIAFARSPRVGFLVVFFLTLLLLASVIAVYDVAKRYFADVSYTKSAIALQSNDLDGAQAAADRSVLLLPSDRTYRLESLIALSRMNSIASDTTLSQDQARTQFQAALSQAVAAAVTATQLGASDYQNWVALGNVYAAVVPLGIDGSYDNAKTAYTHAQDLSPANPTLPYVMAQLEIAHKDNAAAETALTNAINLKHNYTQAIFLLSQLEVQMGKAKEALQAAEAAAYFAPNDSAVLFQVGLLRLGTNDADGAIAALQSAAKLNPQYANAHFFLAIAYASKKDYADAIAELETVAALSEDNAKQVQPYLTALQAGKNPFPATTLTQTPVAEPQGTASSTK